MRNPLDYGDDCVQLPWTQVWKQKFSGLLDRVYWMFNRTIPLNIVVVGPDDCGKTSIVRRFAGDIFYEEKKEPLSKTFKTVCVFKINNKFRRCRVRITELSRKKSSSDEYHEKVINASGVVFVYSTDEPEKCEELNSMIEKLYLTDSPKRTQLLVLGNKTEICTNLDQVYQNTEIKDRVQSAGVNYYSVSAKSNWGIYDAFDELFFQCASNMTVKKTCKLRNTKTDAPRSFLLRNDEVASSFSEI